MSQASSQPITYKDAGVDIQAGDEMVDLIRPLVERTHNPRVMGPYGAFAGLFRLDYNEKLFKKNYREPVLVGCADGVGSKLLVAIAAGRFDTIGIDLVAMNVNDLVCCGGEPLFFLDYIGTGRLAPRGWPRWSKAFRKAASRLAARYWAGRRPRCRTSIAARTSTWPALPWGWWSGGD